MLLLKILEPMVLEIILEKEKHEEFGIFQETILNEGHTEDSFAKFTNMARTLIIDVLGTKIKKYYQSVRSQTPSEEIKKLVIDEIDIFGRFLSEGDMFQITLLLNMIMSIAKTASKKIGPLI